MTKPIRRSDGKILGDGKDADEKLLERVVSQETSLPKQNDWSKQITRNGEPITDKGKVEVEALDGQGEQKTWEEYKQELLEDLERIDTRSYDQSTDIDCEADPSKYYK